MEAWKQYPPIQFDAPVLALTAGQGWLWAGGPGGVARYPIQRPEITEPGWISCSVGLPLASVSALAFASGWLFAGGADGLARSNDGGQTWERGLVSDVLHPVMCLAVSPGYESDYTVVAGTLGGGVLRSDDAGRTWKPANFGLQNEEVLSLAWAKTGTLLAGTSDGLYCSTNGGRAWRAEDGTESASVTGIAFQADGKAYTCEEAGELLTYDDFNRLWNGAEPGLPAEGAASGLAALPDGGLVLAMPEHGTFLLPGDDQPWQKILDQAVLSVSAGAEGVYLGLADGPLCGVAALRGAELSPLPAPPLHDLRSLEIIEHAPVVGGLYSGAFTWRNKSWQPLLADAPGEVITALSQAPDGALLISCSRGMLRSSDAGKTWQTVLPGEDGMVARITFRAGGKGWAASGDGSRLLQTSDHGQTWEELKAPFGVLPLAALQATAHEVIAATYDPRQQNAQIWVSDDDGQHWKRGAGARTHWPVVAAAGHPPLLTLGGTVFVLQPDGKWADHTIQPGAGVRRVACRGSLIFALTTHGLFRSGDRGKSWMPEAGVPSASETLDLAVDTETLFLLLTGGRVWARPLK